MTLDRVGYGGPAECYEDCGPDAPTPTRPWPTGWLRHCIGNATEEPTPSPGPAKDTADRLEVRKRRIPPLEASKGR